MSNEGLRINKYLAERGVCSRREADDRIAQGRVHINGIRADSGQSVLPGQRVTVDGEPIGKPKQHVYIMLNKPVGIITTSERDEPNNIIDFVRFPQRIFPVGRLDKDSSGLILLTNDGDIVNRILRSGNKHEKEYEVMVNMPVTPQFLTAMSRGVRILGTTTTTTTTKPCKLFKNGKYGFRIILTQGLNRQIRRMCETLDYKVTALKRVRLMHLSLGMLREGAWRHLTSSEVDMLKRALTNSNNAPEKERTTT